MSLKEYELAQMEYLLDQLRRAEAEVRERKAKVNKATQDLRDFIAEVAAKRENQP